MRIMSLTSPNRGWTLEEIEFNSGQLEGIHADLGRLVDFGGNAQIVLRNIDGGLQGRGQSIIRRVQTESGALADRIGPTLSGFGRIADVVRGYGEAVATHAKAANDVIGDIEATHRAHEAAVAALDSAEDQQQRDADADDASARVSAEQGVTDAESSLTSSRAALDDLWETGEAAYALWDEAYGAAMAALLRSDGTSASAATLSAIDALANADSPAEVTEIWDSLTDAQCDTLRQTSPAFVGNLEGVPYLDRFLANRAAYDSVVAAGPYGEPLDTQFAFPRGP